MEPTLGTFGDERLKKGGLFYINGLSLIAAKGSASADWAAGGPARCGLRVFCIIPR
jgi:hypothetical protein